MYEKKKKKERKKAMVNMCGKNLFLQPQSDPEDAAGPSNEPTPKRLRSDEGVRIILLSPNGTRHTLDFQMEDTLAVGHDIV